MENSNPIKKHLPKIILLVLISCGAYYGYNKYKYRQSHEDTDNAQIETYFVPVLPRMAGYVKAVHVRDYENVQQGTVLAEIDADEAKLILAELQADYLQAQTDIENAKANILNLGMSVKSVEANLRTTLLRRDKAQKDSERDMNLLNTNAITKRQADDSKANQDILTAQYEAGKEDIAATKSKLPILQAALHKAEAILGVKKVKIEQQRLKLTYSQVLAPTSGRIGKKTVEAGQFIQAGQPLMTIVQDTTFWVIANFKETQVSRLKIGSEAEIKLDAYPDKKLRGKIISIAESTGAKTALLPPDNASGNFVKVTQRVPVKIEILDLEKNKDMLRAGLSLEVSVKVVSQ